MNPPFIWFLVVCAGVGMASAQPTFLPGEDPKPAGKVWKQVPLLSDEFDGAALDATKWQSEPVGNGWSWYGRAPGLFRAENVKLKDGKMCVTVSKLDAPVVRGGKTFTHQGAIVRSLHPGQPGWYFECRMKANATVMSSTFWLITKPSGGRGGLELDIQECIGLVTEKTEPWAKKWDRIFHSNLIHWTKPEKVQLQGSVPTPDEEQRTVLRLWRVVEVAGGGSVLPGREIRLLHPAESRVGRSLVHPDGDRNLRLESHSRRRRLGGNRHLGAANHAV